MNNKTDYSAHNESIKLGILLALLCISLIYGDWLWRWDRLIYDVQSSMFNQPARDDIVIIAVDEYSLQSIGRWPWPRNIHAQLIEKLSEHEVSAILIDMIFSEPSANLADDIALAEAIKNNGKVSLPVLLEQTRLRGQLIETLPLPKLTQNAASIGHVHVELDLDGIARGSYLYEGLGQARWPHITLSLLQALNYKIPPELDTPDTLAHVPESQWSWLREKPFLIPYIGPPGSFKRVSYISVLSDQVLAESLENKIVLVGVTASGLGDSLPTPVSGFSHSMPGIEINANILQAIMDSTLITEIDQIFIYIISSCLIVLPILSFAYLSPRNTLILVIGVITLLFISSLSLLHIFKLWFPPSAVFICLVLSYPLWAWRRLEFTVKYLNNELETLSNEASKIQQYVAEDTEMPFVSLQNLIPVSGIHVFDDSKNTILQKGKPCTKCNAKLTQSNWTHLLDNEYAIRVKVDNTLYRLCIQWRFETAPNEAQTRLLKTYVRLQVNPQKEKPISTIEIIESRMQDIKNTADKLAYLRQFITDSLEQMADGVVVIDNLGTVTLANKQAVKLLSDELDIPLLHESIMPVLDRLKVSGSQSWDSIIQSVLSNKSYENLQVTTNTGYNLIVNIRPLYNNRKMINGFIINLSDITALKEAQKQRNEMLSFLSHDLRSPLVSVLAILEQNKNGYKDSTINKRIEKNINHTIELAEDFVHLSRLEGEEEIKFSSVNLCDVIANAVDTVWDQATHKNTTISQSLEDDIWMNANGSILERVIINLLSNAIKYCDSDSKIEIALYQQDKHIHCTISDNGPGIEAEQINLLFDRFKRIENSQNKQSGIGLGLAFVHAAVVKHQGKITVQSEVGKGSCFHIIFPSENIT